MNTFMLGIGFGLCVQLAVAGVWFTYFPASTTKRKEGE